MPPEVVLRPDGSVDFLPLGRMMYGAVDIGIDIDVDMDIDSDMAVSTNWGSFKGSLPRPMALSSRS